MYKNTIYLENHHHHHHHGILTNSGSSRLILCAIRYNADEARNLKQYGELPENTKINEGGDDEEEEDDGMLEFCRLTRQEMRKRRMMVC
jgi:hypothetical protein